MDILQQEDEYHAIARFIGGLNSYGPEDQIADNQLAYAKNAILEENGVITRRGGLTQLGSLETAGYTQGDAAGASDVIVAGDGTNRTLITVVSRTSGIWVCRYNGSTWSISALNIGTCSNDDSTLTWLRASSGNEYVYVNTPHVTGAQYAIQVYPTVAFSIISSSEINTDPPFRHRYMVNGPDLMVLGGVEGVNRDKLYFSDFIPNLETFDQTVLIMEMLSASGQAVTGLSPYRENMVFVGTQSGCVLLRVGTGAFLDWAVNVISSDVGVGSHKSIRNVAEDLLFADQGGHIRMLSSLLSGDVATRQVPVSMPINDVIQDISAQNIHRMSAAFWNSLYWLSVKRSTGWELYVYNIMLNTWTGPFIFKSSAGNTLGIQSMVPNYADIGVALYGDASRTNELIMMGYDGQAATTAFQAYSYDGSLYTDPGSQTIDFDIHTKAFDFGTPHAKKVLKWVEIEFERVSAAEGSVDLYIRTEEHDDWKLIGESIDYTDGTRIIRRRIHCSGVVSPSKTIQARITCSGTKSHPRIVKLVFSYKTKEPTAVL